MMGSLKLERKLAEITALIIDDEPEIRLIIREILAEMGVTRMFDAPDGETALGLIGTDFDMINFVICDWNMPKMQGIDFLRQLRTSHPDIPFLMITGRSDKASVIDAKLAGVSAYIRKPFSPKELEEKIKALLERQQ